MDDNTFAIIVQKALEMPVFQFLYSQTSKKRAISIEEEFSSEITAARELIDANLGLFSKLTYETQSAVLYELIMGFRMEKEAQSLRKFLPK